MKLSRGAREVVAFWFSQQHKGPIVRQYAREVIAEMRAAKQRACA